LVFSGNNMRKVDKIMPVKDIFAQLKQQVAEID
ncbi:MAG: nitronate monooxygenase, partial [Veillonella sp.]